MAKVLKRSKKTRKNITDWIVSIIAWFNNTHVTVSDENGNVLTWSTWWRAWFRWSRESTPYAAQMTSEQAITEAKTLHGLEKVKVYVSWIWSWREQAMRGIIISWVEVTQIYDITPIPHNWCRKKKVRKL